MGAKTDWPQVMLDEIWEAMKSGPVRIERDNFSGVKTGTYCIDAYNDHFHIMHQCNAGSFAVEVATGLREFREARALVAVK